MNRKPDWLQGKGYLHITPSLSIDANWKKYYNRITSPQYISTYAFYPLMHRILSDRKYKKPNPKKHEGIKRSHCHKIIGENKVEKSAKNRPLHYASHFDVLIYSYYADTLGKLYEEKLQSNEELNKAVLAYRRIPISKTNQKGKSNIHFANEVFSEINRRVESEGSTSVLAIDLKNFFSSLSHEILYDAWAKLLNVEELPTDHRNVFKACTNFSYILHKDLKQKNGFRFDESKLAKIRRENGFKSFFESNEAFRNEIKNGRLPIYKNPFRKFNEQTGKKEMIGIPQGLPISALLANLYLLNFDSHIIKEIASKYGAHYRRYSDDILILCKPSVVDEINSYINNLISRYRIEISTDKTERFLFKKMPYNKTGDERITSIKILSETENIIDCPVNYLGFEFRGYNTLIKSTNLAKYYRRLITIIKRRARRALKLSFHNPNIPKAVYINQIKKLYNSPIKYADKLENKQVFRKRHSLIINDRGDFTFDHFDVEVKNASNYISYLRRCKKEFNSNSFSLQLKKKKQIIGQAINKHLQERY
ncbi:reverse transcriptase domain-containing protein [Pedobacter sp. D749]|uniref:reverse transcriptase domain-containing protein n=1 Tax=Pedobacter sp. D749 TaxID=2856523 RepID=UPI001C58942C|nr:reverse transcriptase domain-containing protein [Pedobacter sp. D749]QXU39818.1 hypothetical protein KYH19_12340 [Pedobacter sp. D749]